MSNREFVDRISKQYTAEILAVTKGEKSFEEAERSFEAFKESLKAEREAEWRPEYVAEPVPYSELARLKG